MTGNKLLILIALLLTQFDLLFSGISEVNPGMETEAINLILNSAKPGDTLLFHTGSYTGPFVLENLNGRENLPVVISGRPGKEGKLAEIDGQTNAGMNLKHNAFFLENCSWITLENFAIKNCWTDLIRAENTSYLSIRSCKLSGGKRALFATGRESHHFLIEHCTWEQDKRVWTHAGDFSWDEIHHGIHRHYNGSFFQGSGISGVAVLRDNKIQNTFNAFRLSQINEGALDPLACSNMEIYRNLIINTSDNVLEPEVHALNLHFYHNQMINGHAFVSITEVAGGEIYIYGNTAVSLPDSEDGWTIFKISSDETSLSKPLYIFNNSWQVDFDMIGSPRHVWKNDHILHFNNACFSEVSDSFGIYNLGADNHFDFDCSNVPFPTLLTNKGLEKNGMVADPLFRDPYKNDFRLQENSPCIDRGTNAWGLLTSFHGDQPDIGAYENGKPVDGPPFRFVYPEEDIPFEEMPRITRYHLDGQNFSLWFSVPMDSASMSSAQVMLDDGRFSTELDLTDSTEDGYCLKFKLQEEAGAGAVSLLLSDWPLGRNGKILTSWASALSVRLTK